MQNCIPDSMRGTTNLEDQYQSMRNIPPLLICNHNNDRERVNMNLLKNSVLLKDIGNNVNIEGNNVKNNVENNVENFDLCNINSNFSNRIYSRNVGEGDIHISLEPRPLPADKCADPRFQKERESIIKYNHYDSKNSLKNGQYDCNNKVFLPHKGTVKGFFDNIDVDSHLKNINVIDTKCKLNLFKVHPEDKKSPLNCYHSALIKDYQSCDPEYGYTWDNFNQCTSFEKFPVCKSKDIPCAISETSRNQKKIVNDNVSESGQMITNKQIRDLHNDIKLLEKKKAAEIQLAMTRKPEMKNVSPDIITYNSLGVQNIYAPNVLKRNDNLREAEAQGYHDGISQILDARAEANLRELAEQKIDKKQFAKVIELQPTEQVNLSRYNCIQENQKLYSFNNQMDDPNRECYFCERLFNNQTKRKNIVP